MTKNPEQREVNKQVGARVARAITQAKLRQSEVADKAGMDRSALNRIIKGERRLSPADAQALANILGGEPGRFLSDQPASVPAEELPDGLADYLARFGDRIAPVVKRHLERSQFHTEGVALDDRFWDEQRLIWERRLGLSGGASSGESPPKK